MPFEELFDVILQTETTMMRDHKSGPKKLGMFSSLSQYLTVHTHIIHHFDQQVRFSQIKAFL